jgi:hypothetical protein
MFTASQSLEQLIMNPCVKITLLALAVVAIAITGPLITMWALNTIFPQLNIPTNFWTWLAMATLQLQIVYKSTSK